MSIHPSPRSFDDRLDALASRALRLRPERDVEQFCIEREEIAEEFSRMKGNVE